MQGIHQIRHAIQHVWSRTSARLPHPRSRAGQRALATFTLLTLIVTLGVAFSAAHNAHASTDINTSALLHDSRDTLYRSPGGALPTGQSATLRLRAAANNAGEVTLRIWNTAANGGQGGQQLIPTTRVFSNSIYDYWQAVIPPQSSPRTLWYKWLVTSTDKTQQIWYEDHYDSFLHGCDQIGGVGQTFASGQDPDCSYRLNIYASGFTAPEWVKHAVIYQIFVDRFFNGLTSNDAINQPLKYDSNGCLGPDGKPTASGYYLHTDWNDEPLTPPQGCDFYGGDLQGIIAKLDYLRGLGVNTLYLNPIFMADSNHKYDTTDYAMIDPHFGNLAVWQQLVQQAHRMGMHIILDGVFNHTSSDSLYFDRYHTWQRNGADETQSSPYEDWYQFTKWPAYNGWFGFDSLPQLTEQQDVRNFIFAGDPNFVQDAGDAAIRQQFGEQPLTAPPGGNSIAKYWLAQGADAWRLDVAESKSDGWWQQFRAAIKSIDPEAISIGEHWSDASQWLLGGQQDGTMNYLFRDAVINFFDKGGIDPDTGHDNHEAFTPSQFDAHLQKVLENYPLAAVYSSMNLVDSHDTGRILWELGDTTGSSAAQIAQAKQTMRLIALFQMTWVGAPTIYYGDEAGQTQSTYDTGSGPRVDPGDRRTFPWDHPDTMLQSWYSQWIHVRQQNEVLQTGAEQTLLTDDTNHIFAFQRRDDSSIALVILNDDSASNAHTVTLNVSNVGDGATFTDAASGEQFTVSNGHIAVPVNGLSGRVLLARGAQVRRPAVPQNIQAFHLNGANMLQWRAVQSPDLAGYDIYRSNITNGLYIKINATPVTGTSYTDQGTDNAKTYYYVVRAVSNQSVESLDSVVVKPVVHITFAGNLSPATLTATLNVKSGAITATVTAPGSTDQSSQGPWITAQIGYGPSSSNPNSWSSWTAMTYQGKSSDGQSDIYSATTTPEALGTSAFLARFSGDDGVTWIYAYVDHSTTPGSLTISAATDATPPAAPTGLATSASAQQVTLTWNPVPNPSAGANIWRYHIARATSSGGPFNEVGTLLASDAGNSPSFTDTDLTNGMTYYYTVAAESNALVKGPVAGPVSAVPHVPAVHVTFNVAIPYYTPSSDVIHIAGDYVNNWDPGATSMSKIDATHWAITMDLPLGKTINYKYTRGSWDSVQKDPLGREINNLQYTLPDTDGAQVTIFDSVASWRDVAPPANAVAVQWNVQAPSTTPANAQLFLAGDAWGWSPNGAALRNIGGGNWQYTQIFAAGTTINYKYTRGSWDTVEVDSNFNDIPNRTLTATAQQSQSNNGFTYTADFQTDSVANWHDHPSAQQVNVTFTVMIPAGLPASDKVYIAGDQINGWNPSTTPLTQIDATHWTYTQTYNAGSTIQYKYTLGSWESVEVDSAGNDIGNRQLTVADQGGSKMSVSDTVQGWKSVP